MHATGAKPNIVFILSDDQYALRIWIGLLHREFVSRISFVHPPSARQQGLPCLQGRSRPNMVSTIGLGKGILG